MNEISGDNRTKKDIVDEFLEDVKKKLPFWLKDEKEELDEILEELENHIWDKATELADGEDPSIDHIEQVLDQMGKPSKIAAEYKNRGKPKYFITEELFPMYQKTLGVTAAILFGINFIIMLFSIGSGHAARSFFTGIFICLAITLIVVTAQFVYLSKEGYYPEDFQRFSSRLPFSINLWFKSKSESTRVESAVYDGPEETTEEAVTRTIPAVEKVDTYDEQYDSIEPVKTIEPRVSIVKETKYIEKRPGVVKETVIVKEPVIKTRTTRVKKWGGNYLSDGIFGMIFGTVVIVLAFLPVLESVRQPTSDYYPLHYWFVLSGGITLLAGIIRFMQAIVGRALRAQQGLMFLHMLPEAAKIPLWLVLLRSIWGFGPYSTQVMNLFEWIVYKFGQLVGKTYGFDPAVGLIILKVFVYFNVAIAALRILSEISKIFRLEAEGFPVKEVEHYR
ncbi:MAG: hypothetical protein FK733_12320 [Asgard group archaeon]|nr:hypothetical protein [Asgard group archaeon]